MAFPYKKLEKAVLGDEMKFNFQSPSEFYIKCNEDAWMIDASDKDNLKLFHNNYKVIDENTRVIVSGYHNQNQDGNDFKYMINYISGYTWEKHLEAKRLQMVAPYPGEAANIVLVQFVKDGGKVAGDHDGQLPENGVKIKAGKLRGIESFGMMCSIDELGSSTEMYPDAAPDGIYILPEDAPIGEDAIEYLGLHDANYEFEITSNRVDCYSVLGIAREAAATFRKPFILEEPKVNKTIDDINNYCWIRKETRKNLYRFSSCIKESRYNFKAFIHWKHLYCSSYNL